MSVIYRVSWNAVPGSYGYSVEYRESDSAIWTTPVTSANPTLFTYYDLVLETGTTYYIRVGSNGTTCATNYTLHTLDVPAGSCCPATYTLSPDESYCYKEETTAPTVVTSDICLASSQLAGQYSSAGTKRYNTGYNSDLTSGTYTLLTSSYWKEAVASVTGPMNREAVWVDTDCNGTKDPLTAGAVLQITIPIT